MRLGPDREIVSVWMGKAFAASISARISSALR